MRSGLRVGRGEQHGHRAPLGAAEQRRPLHVRGIHDGANVLHPLLQGGERGQRDRVRDAGAPLVEAEEPAECPQATQEARQRRLFPHDLDVAEPVRDEDHVERAIPDDLIGDVAVLAVRELRLGRHVPAACADASTGVNDTSEARSRVGRPRIRSGAVSPGAAWFGWSGSSVVAESCYRGATEVSVGHRIGTPSTSPARSWPRCGNSALRPGSRAFGISRGVRHEGSHGREGVARGDRIGELSPRGSRAERAYRVYSNSRAMPASR